MKINNFEILIKIYPIKSESKLANVTLILGPCQVKGFTIRKSEVNNEGIDSLLFLTPPAKKVSGGRWFKLFWTDKETWKTLEDYVVSEFIRT